MQRSYGTQRLRTKGIVGGHLNIQSIISKQNQVQHLLTNSNLDYLCLTETWLNCNIPTQSSAQLDVPGYVCFRKDRLMGRGGLSNDLCKREF